MPEVGIAVSFLPVAMAGATAGTGVGELLLNKRPNIPCFGVAVAAGDGAVIGAVEEAAVESFLRERLFFIGEAAGDSAAAGEAEAAGAGEVDSAAFFRE